MWLVELVQELKIDHTLPLSVSIRNKHTYTNTYRISSRNTEGKLAWKIVNGEQWLLSMEYIHYIWLRIVRMIGLL